MKTMTIGQRIEAVAEEAAKRSAEITRRHALEAINGTTADVRSLARSLARYAEFPWDAQMRVSATPIDLLIREVRVRHRAAHANRDGVSRRSYLAGLYVDLRVQKTAGAKHCVGEVSQIALELAAAHLSGQAFVISRGTS